MFYISLLKQWRESTIQKVLGNVKLEDATHLEYFEVEKFCGGGGLQRQDNDVKNFSPMARIPC